MKNTSAVLGRHAFHKLLIAAVGQMAPPEKAELRTALFEQLGLKHQAEESEEADRAHPRG